MWEVVGTGDKKKKRTKPVIFARLGVAEELDAPMLRSARDAFDRYLARVLREEAEARGEEPVDVDATADAVVTVERIASEVRPRLEPRLRLLTTRKYGLRVIIERAWKQLGLHLALRRVGEQHRIKFDFERVVFGMVLNRLVDPKSKLACNDLLQEDAYFPEAEGWTVDTFYWALDVLEDHLDDIEGHIGNVLKQKLGLSKSALLLTDTTSTYFESDDDDREHIRIARLWDVFDRGEGDEPTERRPQVVNDPPLRLRGKSKDKRPDKPQVVVATVATTDGRVLRHRTYAGNTNDQRITGDMLEAARTLSPRTRPVFVMDSGMASAANLAAIDALPGAHRISAVPMRKSKFGEEKVLRRAGRWMQHPNKDHFKLRRVVFTAEASPSGRAGVWLATRNERARARELRRIDGHLKRVKAVVDKDDRLFEHNKGTCHLLTKKHLARFVRKSANGKRLLLDRARVSLEKRRAGVHLLRSTLFELSSVDTHDAYQELLGVEANFRTFKGPLRLRPMCHRSAHRIRAHVMASTLSKNDPPLLAKTDPPSEGLLRRR